MKEKPKTWKFISLLLKARSEKTWFIATNIRGCWSTNVNKMPIFGGPEIVTKLWLRSQPEDFLSQRQRRIWTFGLFLTLIGGANDVANFSCRCRSENKTIHFNRRSNTKLYSLNHSRQQTRRSASWKFQSEKVSSCSLTFTVRHKFSQSSSDCARKHWILRRALWFRLRRNHPRESCSHGWGCRFQIILQFPFIDFLRGKRCTMHARLNLAQQTTLQAWSFKSQWS